MHIYAQSKTYLVEDNIRRYVSIHKIEMKGVWCRSLRFVDFFEALWWWWWAARFFLNFLHLIRDWEQSDTYIHVRLNKTYLRQPITWGVGLNANNIHVRPNKTYLRQPITWGVGINANPSPIVSLLTPLVSQSLLLSAFWANPPNPMGRSAC
jgi:hypothetical protein